jgi:hypothetical protein
MTALWEPSKPVSGSNIVDIPAIHNHIWDAFEDTFDVEHYTFSETLTACGQTVHMSGRHIAGQTAVLCAAASASIENMGTPACGSLSLDLENSTFILSWDGAMRSLSISGASDGNYVKRTVIVVAASADHKFEYEYADSTYKRHWEMMPLDTEVFDYNSKWDTGTYKLTPGASGLYMFVFNTTLSGTQGQRVDFRFRYDYWDSGVLASADIATFSAMCKSTSGNSFQGTSLWMCPSGAQETPVVSSRSTVWFEGMCLDQTAPAVVAASAIMVSGVTASGTGNSKTQLCVMRLY